MNETSTERKHRMMVMDLAKPANEINMSHLDTHLMHAALGIAGEGGEVVDLIKKTTINGKPLDTIEMMKELGDLEWYLTLLRSVLGIDREVVLQMNIEKLRQRYKDGYSDEASVKRADVMPENCNHPTLEWRDLTGYTCTVCDEPADAVQDNGCAA